MDCAPETRPLEAVRLVPARAAAWTINSYNGREEWAWAAREADVAEKRAIENATPRRVKRWRRTSRCAVEPALDGSNGQAQGVRREFLGVTLEVAENDQGAEPFGQAVDFLVENGGDGIVVGGVVEDGLQFGGAALAITAATGDGLGTFGGSPGDAVQPRSERVVDPELARLAQQNEEGGLKGVLSVVRIAEKC